MYNIRYWKYGHVISVHRQNESGLEFGVVIDLKYIEQRNQLNGWMVNWWKVFLIDQLLLNETTNFIIISIPNDITEFDDKSCKYEFISLLRSLRKQMALGRETGETSILW